ncbi:MAG: hypothetical protein ACF8CQ_16760, partial [Rhodopirellula sp. JB044]|uniref:hypothetical protein n=1 Tax=Rhodopirellula sp. JB044 TaxID=3342844 RepID=UPI00370C7A63
MAILVGLCGDRRVAGDGVVDAEKGGFDMSGADWSNDARSTMLLGSPRDVGHGQQPPARSEMLPQTKSAIERFADRRARLQLCRGVMLGVAALVVGLLLVVLLEYGFRMGTMIRCALAILVDVVAVSVAWFGGVRASRRRDWREVALSMEAVTPVLRERLLSAVELEDPRVANGSVEFRGKLQTGVASELSKVEIRRMLPWSLIRRSLFFATGVLGLVAGVSAIPSLQMPRRMARALVPFVPIERASFTKIEIVEPSPASAIVAEGDLVSVAATLQHLGDRVVELQWRDENGRRGNQIMAARDYAVATVLSDETFDEIQQHGERERRSFAANIQVDNVTVHYRVVAADAETLWHTLTPMPRPRALEFEKRYKFPSYAKLPDQVVVDQHGDLEAIVGTRAEVSVRFDQPVRAAEVSFGDADSDVKVPMNSVDGDATRFQYRVAVTTPGGYRINAVSSQSGFDNPFLPRWAIDPVTDQNPVAAWASDVDRRQICSPAAVLRLRGRVEDDLPMDRFIFQYARDDDSVRERSLPINPAEDNHAFAFDWDMEDLAATGTAREVLPAGTRLKARLIALDRAGHRGASEWLHVFIDGADFDAKRHDDLYEMHAFTRAVNQWWGDLDRWIRQSVESLQREADGNEVTATPSQVMPMEELNALAERWQRIAGTASANGEVRDVDGKLSLRELVARTNDPVAADRWVMLDRAVSTQISRLLGVANAREGVSVEPMRESLSQTQSFAGEVRDLVAQTLAIELAVAAYSDFRSIRTATLRLGDENANIPIERLSGQAELLVEHLRQNDAMIAELQDELPNDTVRHLQSFRQFLDETAVRIEEAGETLRLDRNPDVESNFRDAMHRHGEAMSGRHFGFLVHSSTFDRIAGAVRQLASPRWQPNSEFVRLGERANERDERFALAGDRLLRAYDEATEWEKVRRDSIVEVAADERLVQRVVEHLTQEEFLGQGPSDNDELFARIREATEMLYSGGRAIRLMRQLQDMIDRERHGTDDADLQVQQTIRLSHYQMAGEAPLQYLLDRHRGDDRFEKLRATRWADDYTIARQRITRRLHHVDAIVSAAAPVQRMVDVYGDAMTVIETSMHEAREMLRSLLPSVVELARKAAADARRDNAEDRLDQLQDDVQRVAESLVDRADRADLTDDAERELAVDADAALREIQRRMEAVSIAEEERGEEERGSENPNDVSEALDALADTLERTADHFAASDAGEDVTQTRDALRENAGDDSGRDREAETTPEAIDDARDEAESAEQLARSDPQELLRRLEERLQRDPPMQASLGEIGERTVVDVENAVRAVAEQESDLQRQLERSDSEFVERKRAVRDRVDSIVSQARSVERQWLATAEKASFRARDQRLLDRV